MTCTAQGCTRRHLEGYEFCRHHKCQSFDCRKAASSGRTWCISHMCYYPSCERAHTAYSWACGKHKCKSSRCQNILEVGSAHCQKHMCSRAGCTRGRKGDTNGCKIHVCQMADCRRLRVDATNSGACEKHTCYADGCPKVRQSRSHNFCRRHSCQWTLTPCPERAEAESRFCEQHKCPNPDCTSSCRKAGEYCNGCRCRYDTGCSQPHGGESVYCENHTCFNEGCHEPIVDGSYYCNGHTCQWDLDEVRCSRLAISNKAWCEQHKCADNGCPSSHIEDGSYCKSHTCSEQDCNERRDPSDGKKCRAHMLRVIPIRLHQVPSTTGKAKGPLFTMSDIEQAYAVGYVDGLGHGTGLDGEDARLAKIFVSERTDSGGDNRRRGRELLAGLINEHIAAQRNAQSLGGMAEQQLLTDAKPSDKLEDPGAGTARVEEVEDADLP